MLRAFADPEGEDAEEVDTAGRFETALFGAYYDACSRSRSRFLRAWSEFDRNLRNVTAAVTARAAGRPVEEVTVGGGDVVEQLERSSAADFGLRGELPYIDAVIAAVNDEANLVEKEHKIDLIRWNEATELATFDYFDINTILSYLARVNIVARWTQLDAVRGREMFDRLMAELDGLCGLDKVKADVKSLINLVKVRRLRQEHGLPVPPMSLHLVFLGNPGTGKTTVARLLAKIYRAIGVLSKGQLVEVDRSGLVAGFVGQTALKTGEVIEKALGGVLFIDEAYALANQDAPNDFGREAIETLLKGMEDHRDDLIVIAAGYTELMGRFLHANPGLESRFNKYFYFEDYNGAQLLAIFQSMCAKNGYTLDDKATEYAKSYFKTLYEERDENFGNARDVRNVFERAVARQSDRVAALEKPGKEELMALTVADLQEEGGPVPDGAPDETLPESP